MVDSPHRSPGNPRLAALFMGTAKPGADGLAGHLSLPPRPPAMAVPCPVEPAEHKTDVNQVTEGNFQQINLKEKLRIKISSKNILIFKQFYKSSNTLFKKWTLCTKH